MTETQEVTFTLTRTQWLSANDRMHWAVKSKRTRAIRAVAKEQAVKLYRGKPLGVVRIVAEVSYPTARRSDPANSYPTIKAAVDGLVDAGWLSDDDAQHVIGPDMRLGKKTGVSGLYRIRLTVTPATAIRRDEKSVEVETPTPDPPTNPSGDSVEIRGTTETGKP